jgi:predicted HicB family RNase H-like nuclease
MWIILYTYKQLDAPDIKGIRKFVNSQFAIRNLNRRFGMATINLRNVPDDLHRKAKARAAMEGVTLKQLIMRLLEEYLEGVC